MSLLTLDSRLEVLWQSDFKLEKFSWIMTKTVMQLDNLQILSLNTSPIFSAAPCPTLHQTTTVEMFVLAGVNHLSRVAVQGVFCHRLLILGGAVIFIFFTTHRLSLERPGVIGKLPSIIQEPELKPEATIEKGEMGPELSDNRSNFSLIKLNVHEESTQKKEPPDSRKRLDTRLQSEKIETTEETPKWKVASFPGDLKIKLR
ncbi:uncharacterized protein LOC116992350 [Catharus ustulatus]|uniref:uncharacterized protein LOC116992350 n=1 Tax=Catharus ustulatus TaxID=91951 RepID=UPI001408BE66|nr:uncharacterized protein LOC116992350 [Catharus ustulatus]